MLTTSEGEFDTKNVTRNIVYKVKIYFKKYIISVNVYIFLQEEAHLWSKFIVNWTNSCKENIFHYLSNSAL